MIYQKEEIFAYRMRNGDIVCLDIYEKLEESERKCAEPMTYTAYANLEVVISCDMCLPPHIIDHVQ